MAQHLWKQESRCLQRWENSRRTRCIWWEKNRIQEPVNAGEVADKQFLLHFLQENNAQEDSLEEGTKENNAQEDSLEEGTKENGKKRKEK